MVSAAEWARIQEIERQYQEQKDPSEILAINLAYWERILAQLPPEEVRIGPETRVLDVGCGGAGILLGVTEGIRTGVDPLMGYYLEKFAFLRDAPVRWVEGTAEDFAADESFDVIFSINVLDHVFDPIRSARNLERLLAADGRLVLVVNTHLTRLFRRYFALFYRFVDPPHPHQIHRDEVPRFFPGLRLVFARDIDDLWLDLESRYKEKVCHRPRRDLGKLLRNLANPFQYPLAAARILARRPVHRQRVHDRPLMASRLFVFARKRTST